MARDFLLDGAKTITPQTVQDNLLTSQVGSQNQQLRSQGMDQFETQMNSDPSFKLQNMMLQDTQPSDRAFFYGNYKKVGQGMSDLLTVDLPELYNKGKEVLGIQDPNQTSDAMSRLEAKRIAENQATQAYTDAHPIASAVSYAAGQSAPFMVGGAATKGGMVGLQAGQGALAGLMQNPGPDGSRLVNAGVGAGLGAAGGAILGKLGGLPSNVGSVGNMIAGGKGTGFNSLASEAADYLSKQTGVNFTLGQSTMNRGLLMQEAATSSIAKNAMDVTQAKQAMNHFYNIADQITDKAGNTSGINRNAFNATGENQGPQITDLVNQARGALQNTISSMKSGALKNWTANMAPAVAEAGTKPVIPVTNFLNAINGQLAETANQLPTAIQGKTNQFLQQLKTVADGNGGLLNINQFTNYLSSLTKAAYGKGQLFDLANPAEQQSRQMAIPLKQALLSDLDGVDQAPMSQTIKSSLSNARDGWHSDMNDIDSILNSSVAALVGKRDTNAILPEAFLKNFSTMEPSQIGLASNILDKTNPDIMQGIRQAQLTKTLAGAQIKDAPDGTIPYDFGYLLKQLNGNPKLNALMSPDINQQLKAGVQALQKLQTRMAVEPEKSNIASTLTNVATAIANNDPTIATKIINRTFGMIGLPNMLFNPKLYPVIRGMADSSANSTKFIASTVHLFNNSMNNNPDQGTQ